MATAPLLFKHFIASPLLPCGPADGLLKKYTGNDTVSVAPARNDALTSLLHAFSHFTYVKSDRQLLLCDLQGNASYLTMPVYLHLTNIRSLQ